MADDAPTLELRIQDNSEKAVQGILSLANSLSVLKTNVSHGLGLDKVITQLDTFNQKLQATFSNEAVDKINKVADALSKLAAVREVKIPEISVGKAVQEAVSGASLMPEDMGQAVAVQGVTEAADKMRDYTRTVEEAKAETSQLEENVADVDTKMEDQARSATNASDAVKEHAMSLKDLAGAAKKVIHPLDDIIKKFNRILFYRVIRSVLKEIAKGFSEGIKNVRAYSKAISGSFDKAMTGAENSLFKLKNSLGAALAPALEAIIPHVQNLVSWFITLINYVNQFIALITGKSQWTRAIDASAASFEKTKKSAAGAAKEVKNLLAGFDELNIIQRESGGGGGGAGKIEPDYTTAFEEVYKFDEKIKNIVNWLKENMEAIKAIAIDLGALFLAWRVSNAFSGMIGKLGSLIAAGALIKLTWDITTKLDDEYLKTGDIGWLIANVVETAVGAFIGGNIAKQILGEGKASAGVAIVLTVSALADIVADIQHVDVSALSKESIGLLLTAAVKGGAAGVFIAKTLQKFGLVNGLSGGKMVSIAGGASLATFGAGLTLKAMVNAVNTEEFGDENLRATLEGAITLGSGLAWLGKTTGLLSTKQAIGTSVAGTIATLGAYVGLEAFVEAKKVGYSEKFWKDTALASLGIGASSFIQALIMGVPLGMAGWIAGGAAVATVGALVWAAAVVRGNKDLATWGTYDADKKEIEAFVQQKMFSVPVTTTLELIDTKIIASTTEKERLAVETADLFGEVRALILGINEGSTFTNLKTKVFGDSGDSGLLGTFKKYAEAQKTLIKTSFSLIPAIDVNGKDISSAYIGDAISGWDTLTAGMTKLGEELSGHLMKAADEKLSEDVRAFERNAVSEITMAMIRITEAVTTGNLEAEAYSGLTFDISDLSKESTEELITAFSDYRSKLEEGYRDLYTQTAQSYLSLARGANAMAEEQLKLGNAELAKEYQDLAKQAMTDYEELVANLDSTVNERVDSASKAGRDLIIKKYGDVYAEAFADIQKKFSPDAGFVTFFQYSFDSADDAGEYLRSELVRLINQYTDIDESQLKKMDLDIVSILPESFRETAITEIANKYGLEIAGAFARAINTQVPESIRESVENAEKEAAQKLKTEKALGDANSTLDKLRQQEALIDKLQTQIAEKEAILKQPTSWDYITDRYKGAERALYYGSGVLDTSGGLYKQLEDAKAKAEETRKQLIEEVASYNDIVSEGLEEDEVIIFFTPDYSGFDETPTAPDLSPITDEFDSARVDVTNDVNAILRQVSRLSNIDMNFTLDTRFGAAKSQYIAPKAGGGFVGTGDMFIARESGPELVGRIGNRTAVANNDQIVSGVASGVAAGQSEQNSLLRQQNDLLRQMLAKSGRVEAVPSADWGRFVKRSSEMYAYNTGM